VKNWFQAFAFKWVNLRHYVLQMRDELRLKRQEMARIQHLQQQQQQQQQQMQRWGCTS
jgi:hypothetical protein